MALRAPSLFTIGAIALLHCAPRAAASPPHPSEPLVASAHVQTPAPAAAVSIAIPEIDTLVAQALATHKLPGCVVAVGRANGLSFLRAYGMRALVPAPEPMTEDTIFDLASLTKPIATASAIGLLAERGKLGLAERASRYVHELDRPATRAITVRELLLHAAGLPIEDPMRDYEHGPEAALRALLAQQPVAPLDHFLYSDIGYLWLGALVLRVSGQTLDTFTDSQLFAPLGMTDTRFNPPAELRPRIAPTEVTDDRGTPQALIHGVVHDPRAYRLGGVAGNAGLFSTARDLSRFARMLLGHGALDGTRVLRSETVATLTRPQRVGDSVRTLGWDVHSKYSRLRGTLLSERAFGHGGFTGTSLWIDPERDLFVLLLSNRVHPDGKGNVIALAGAIADAAVRGLGRNRAVVSQAPSVRTGIDVLRQNGFAPLQGKRIGLLTHLPARSAGGESTLEVLSKAPGVRLTAIFSPEHGLDASHEGPLADGRDPVRKVPVYSLYGETRKPTTQMLQGLDLVVVDLVDVGTRFFTYMSTLHEMLRATGIARVPVLVLDRPNPIGGVAVEGPVLDEGQRNFVNHYALPIRHGMSAGELATLMNDDEKLGTSLEVLRAEGWCRDQLFADTGLHWSNPSPNLHSPTAALLYPAVGLLESTNLSVGRGTDQPFEQLGAPFIDSAALLAELRRAPLPGVGFSAAAFTPKQSPYANERCHGLRVTVQDPLAFQPVRAGLEIARALHRLYPDRWQADKLMQLLGSAESMRALLSGVEVQSLERLWAPRLTQFLAHRQRILMYPRCEKH